MRKWGRLVEAAARPAIDGELKSVSGAIDELPEDYRRPSSCTTSKGFDQRSPRPCRSSWHDQVARARGGSSCGDAWPVT